MIIGILPRPTKSRDWAKIKAYLEPAAELGGREVLNKYDEVWTFTEEGELFGAATCCLKPDDKIGEITLVGGRERERWLGQFDWLVGCWFRMEGMDRMRAYGRKGWKRDLEKLGWKVIGEQGKFYGYEKVLR